MSQKIPVHIVEHGFNRHNDWTVNRNDQVEATIDVDEDIVFTLPDKNGRYQLSCKPKDLVVALSKLGLIDL